MQEPQGYVSKGFVGFTDRGEYDSSSIYVKNDLVSYGGTIWRCQTDDLISVTPAPGANWSVFLSCPTGAGGGYSKDILVTLKAEDWTGAQAPYVQNIVVTNMRPSMSPVYYLGSDGDAERYAFGLLTGYTAGFGGITFHAADRPSVDFQIWLKGIPEEMPEITNNVIAFSVDPSLFHLNETTQRYEATVPVKEMIEGEGGIWDIIRSGSVLTEEESKIALSITDVKRVDKAVNIVSTEVPTKKFMMSISDVCLDAEPGSVILSDMQGWFDRVEALENDKKIKFERLNASDVFQGYEDKFDIVYSSFVLNRNVLSVYMQITTKEITETTLMTTKIPYRPTVSYVIASARSASAPYPEVATLWLNDNGNVTHYRLNNNTIYYIYFSYTVSI